jgi:integrase
MGIKLDPKTNKWFAFFSKRHPVTRQTKSLRRRGIKSKAEARRVERELVAIIERKFMEDTIPSWSQVIDEFLQDCVERGLTVHTIHDYESGLKAHTLPEWQDLLVSEVSSSDIRQQINRKVGHRSQSYQKNLLKFIRAVFKYAHDEGYIVRNPTPKMKFQVGGKLKKVLTESQVSRFLQKAKEAESEWYPHWVLATYTGMRNGELYALTWDKVNLETCQIKVDCSWNSKDGFKSTKSGDDRIIHINHSELLPLLKKMKLESDSAFVLPRIDKWDKGEQARELRMFLKGIGLPVVRFHDLRATWATLLLSKGVEPIKVMKLGGWKDMKTMLFYMRLGGVDIKGTTDVLRLHDSSDNPENLLKFREFNE